MAFRIRDVLSCLAVALVVLAADMTALRDCLEICNQRYKECLRRTEGMWKDFYKNVANITAITNRCCLFRAKAQNAKDTDSFGACARIRCKALLWGCEIRKRHEGELSEAEKQHLAGEKGHGH